MTAAEQALFDAAMDPNTDYDRMVELRMAVADERTPPEFRENLRALVDRFETAREAMLSYERQHPSGMRIRRERLAELRTEVTTKP